MSALKKTYYATVPLVGSVRISWADRLMTKEEATKRAVKLAGDTGFRVQITDVDPPPDAKEFDLAPGDEFDCSKRYHNRGDVCLMPVGEAVLDFEESYYGDES